MATETDPVLQPKRPGQRRLLALDGGGIRGLITLGILEKIETDLRRALKKDTSFRLADYFDFIGGTSTGAILATGLSLGMSVAELVEFYLEAGPLMFQKEALCDRLWNKFKSDPLEEKLKDIIGKTTKLGSSKLKTLVLLVLRNVTTDSPWPLTNNPHAKYNDRERPDAISIFHFGSSCGARPPRRPSFLRKSSPSDRGSSCSSMAVSRLTIFRPFSCSAK